MTNKMMSLCIELFCEYEYWKGL